jgi:hypothetical protein
MKRVQLFEFEDFQWFPGVLRTGMTNLIVVFNKMMGVSDVLAKLVSDVAEKHNVKTIVDLGSGAGGAMPEVLDKLKADYDKADMNLVMTDLFPNSDALKKFNSDTHSDKIYHKESVNAMHLESAPAGMKTMINCFHHMPPPVAKGILQSAANSKEPILIYELTENKMPLLLWWLFLPLSLIILIIMSLFMTPFVKPLTWKQLVFTYLIPIIPILYAWDGQASMPRMYSFNDLDELIGDIDSVNYKWEKGFAKNKKGKKLGTYLLGAPF